MPASMHARRLRFPALLLVLAGLAAPGAAHAASGPLLSLTPEKLQAGRATLAQTAWRVRVVVQPWVEGQTATVRFYRNGRRVAKRDVALTQSPTGKSGDGRRAVHLGAPGRVTVQATHLATPGLPQLKARPVRVRILALSAVPGARGPVVRLLQQRLARRGYVVGQRGVYDARTARAVLAFRKVTGMARTQVADARRVPRARRRRRRTSRSASPSTASTSRPTCRCQVLALIRGGKVERIYPISLGQAVDADGPRHVPRLLQDARARTPRAWSTRQLLHRRLRDPRLRRRCPVFAASHGCLRMPVPDAVADLQLDLATATSSTSTA